ncbi:hypothetical protein [Meiothermus hypogaeus]|uniref:Uncharacterized protein n=2 Tax=Meiothermus hypogaeus TaxID=884155 RepID=A0A511R259_9DEIN|nr:hypothetical protein [Meiothermus hypogaeus]RIH80800.1 hypothetical protein Mhypo_00310 [Meiothermus hypogaeus]GEM83690.1 hypothetical protein MHY01S_18560 [Meiothermus hypogaeus NBRC 106114]
MAYSGWGYDPEMAALWQELVEVYAPLAHGIPIRWRVGTKVHQAAAWRKEEGVWTVELSPLLFSRYPIFLGKRYRLPMGLPPLHALVHILQKEERVLPIPLEKTFARLSARAAHPSVSVVAYYALAQGQPLPLLVEMAVGNPDAFATWLVALEEVQGENLRGDITAHHVFGQIFAWALEQGTPNPMPLTDGEPVRPAPLQPYRPLFGPPHAGASEQDPAWKALYGTLVRAAGPSDPWEALLQWRDYWYLRGIGEVLPSDGKEAPGENGEGGTHE